MVSNGTASFQVQLLTGSTYDNWCIKMKALLRDIATLKLKKKTYGQIKFKGGGGVVG
ncbi:hypothetical protein MTR_8g012370 [Medicago truncatula]|uniref:DUF4219 domain-containing protein n=1 Tax=Medicago truncatula TaxID=3880 RepID=G7LF64_MEDTR|nr:hypothetical protein MTR_8g012370 [Medicago truncatula]